MSKLSVNFHDAGFTPAIVLVNQITGKFHMTLTLKSISISKVYFNSKKNMVKKNITNHFG